VPNEDAPIVDFCVLGSQIVEQKNILLYFFIGALEMIHSAYLEILFAMTVVSSVVTKLQENMDNSSAI